MVDFPASHVSFAGRVCLLHQMQSELTVGDWSQELPLDCAGCKLSRGHVLRMFLQRLVEIFVLICWIGVAQG